MLSLQLDCTGSDHVAGHGITPLFVVCFSKLGSLLRVPFIRVPYYIGD